MAMTLNFEYFQN